MTLKERFLDYISFDTQSDGRSTSFPSTAGQLVLLNHLADQMRGMGMTEVEVDAHGYAMGTIPSTVDVVGGDNGGKGSNGVKESRGGSGAAVPVVGFIAHVDTAPDMSGADVKAQIIENYDGGDIPLRGSKYVLRVSEFPELAFYKGHTVVTGDGTTLLGADDKAGVAAIMAAAEHLMSHPEIEHGKIRIGFTPDEEIGRGVDFFDVKRFGADVAYTVDGGLEGELEYENFNAASAVLTIQGCNIHPGYAKGKMINALEVACALNAMLPAQQRPEYTEGYEGFYHLVRVEGAVETAESEYIIRDHDDDRFAQMKTYMERCVELLNQRYGAGTITLTLKDQYYNMRKMVEPHPQIIAKAVEAMKLAGVEPIIRPIRGGTDGSRLSYMGLPCPNIFTGGMNFHGKYEYCSLTSMQRAMATVVNLSMLWAK